MQRDELNQQVFNQNRAMHRMWHIQYRLMNNHVSMAQLGILMKIQHMQPVNGKCIAELLQISRSAVTQLIDGLHHEGYIIRANDPADRRITLLSLSKKGEAQLADMEKQGKAFFSEVTEVLTNEELQQFAHIQAKMLEGLEDRFVQK